MSDDRIFKALADPTRRVLLDLLFTRDGRTLSDLEQHLAMSRFGVMKHLTVLQEAGLITTRRAGRTKLHYLNAVPIRLIHDRWIDKYTEPLAVALTEIKRTLEAAMEKVYEIYIRTTPERLWQAIIETDMRSKYNFGARVTSEWTVGSVYRAGDENMTIFEGENIEVDPPRLLVQTFRARWSDDVEREGTSRVRWEIEPIGDSCRLTVTHDGLREGANPQLYGGWMMILSGLKTLLETGELLTTPGSLRFAEPSQPHGSGQGCLTESVQRELDSLPMPSGQAQR